MAAELKVGIIGGGYAGMAAAAELAAVDIPVTVFESAKQLGGRARGVAYNDTRLDNGQHLLLGCYRETLHLIELVGGDIERDFLRLPMQLDLHHHLELRAPRLPAPFHLLFALLNAKGLSWGERFKAARFMLTLRGMGFRLQQDMTVAELLKLHGQDAGLTLKFWEPLTIAALNTPIDKASAQILLNVLRDALNRARADSDMLLPSIDFTALFPQRAAAFIERHGGKVHLSCAVDAIVPRQDGIALQTAQGSQHFSHVICAASPATAERLLRPLAALNDTVQQIAALEQQPIYTVYLQYPAEVKLPHPMIGLHQRISQWLFDKGRIAGQHGLLASVISAEGIHQDLSQEELAQKVVVELHEEFGIVEVPLWSKVIAEKRATFCCAPNLQRPSQLTSVPNLFLAGDYTAGEYPATLEGAVLSGVHCARLCLPERK
ncbi:MAG: hydroxysqualene dehydroxylase HpnE [Gammaproteobacteria bacterium]|nr:hydroxysqualene dehydroxylase HpnE [Gammaproteobacteria bacterium]MBU1625283.1 hydroxysqualene dehydroxylase HpnE [Gammaproteobacteria bacterium]MBU1981543.1 hydroxysqualene dehydroxylase HpnE [Gammaproteobacteria bacterium]